MNTTVFDLEQIRLRLDRRIASLDARIARITNKLMSVTWGSDLRGKMHSAKRKRQRTYDDRCVVENAIDLLKACEVER